MHIVIENYRGIQHADFLVNGITLVAAPNASGKTSIAQAVSAALNANGLPVPGMTKAMAGLLVRSGAAAGFVSVASKNDPDEDGQQITRVDWPKAVVSTEGDEPPSGSEIGSGAASITEMDKTKRTTFLMELLDAAPKYAHLEKELKKIGITNEEHIKKLWDMIGEIGWDNASSQTKDKGAKMKGQWEYVTGDRYGSKKAETFLPNNWTPDLDGASEESLEQALVKHRESLEAAIAADAVDFAKRAEHEQNASRLPEFQDQLPALQAALDSAKQTHQKALEELNIHPAPAISSQPKTACCPNCNTELVVKNATTLELPGNAPSKAEIEAQQAAHNAAKDAANAAYQVIRDADDALFMVNREIAHISESIEWLDKNSESGDAPSTEVNIEMARNNVAEAEKMLNAFRCKRDADKLHDGIEKNQQILDILAPSGLRQTILSAETREFVATYVTPLTTAAKWSEISFDRDLTISYGGRIYGMLSLSEQFRVRTCLQVAIAMIQKDPMIVVDAADILDNPGRSGLMRLLHKAKVPALVCMTYHSKDEIPDLSKLPNSHSAWIESGRLEVLG